jgi:hypothetical protein
VSGLRVDLLADGQGERLERCEALLRRRRGGLPVARRLVDDAVRLAPRLLDRGRRVTAGVLNGRLRVTASVLDGRLRLAQGGPEDLVAPVRDEPVKAGTREPAPDLLEVPIDISRV